jgi:predicted nucleic acid-binding Zn ribbon protein
MPTYVYRFLDCEGTIEVQQSFSDDALTEAVNPADGKLHPVKKVFTPVGVTFKGGGFYKTDSRGSSSSTTPSSSSAKADGGSSTSSSDSGSSSSSSSSGSSTSSSDSGSSSSSSPSTSSGTHSH